MNILAYTALTLRPATEQALRGAGEMITCPPFVENTLPFLTFMHRDLIVLNLHGLPDHPVWYGDGLRRAMTADGLRGFQLDSAGVFAYNCFLGDAKHPMMSALFDAGASWVVAGAGKNWGGETDVQGADVLLRWFLRSFRQQRNPDSALEYAKIATALTPRWSRQARLALADAREFKLFRRPR